MECIICGKWFSSTDENQKLCMTCERVLRHPSIGIAPERLLELVQAEKDGRLVILEPSAKEGGKRPPCFYNDMGQDLCLGFGRGMEDDEPIDRCKECWYCEANRTLREEAEEADDEYLR